MRVRMNLDGGDEDQGGGVKAISRFRMNPDGFLGLSLERREFRERGWGKKEIGLGKIEKMK